MKIVYILKKGIQCYPPCLAQILYLNDLKADLIVYHGNNSAYVNEILDERGIEHYAFRCDRDSKNRLESAYNFYRYIKEMNKLVRALPKDAFLWFGNCESAIAADKKNLKNRKYLLSILELYETNSFNGKRLKKIIGDASKIIVCEKHRAAIMRVYYPNISAPIYVIPNKPYEGDSALSDASGSPDENLLKLVEKIKNKTVVLYQGMISSDRPLDKIAEALREIGDDSILFLIMGKADEKIRRELQGIYRNTVFTGYVPSPQHLFFTQYATVGIANYDFSCLNNLFCAPNKIYEYTKFGIPVLASKNLGLTETVGAYGCAECVDFLSVEEIKSGLNSILRNISEYSRKAKEFYSATDNESVFVEIMRRLEAKREN